MLCKLHKRFNEIHRGLVCDYNIDFQVELETLSYQTNPCAEIRFCLFFLLQIWNLKRASTGHKNIRPAAFNCFMFLLKKALCSQWTIFCCIGCNSKQWLKSCGSTLNLLQNLDTPRKIRSWTYLVINKIDAIIFICKLTLFLNRAGNGSSCDKQQWVRCGALSEK